MEVGAKRSRTSLQILSIAVCLSDKTESRAGRAHRYRMKCLLHSQPLFMPMPRFDHLANSVVARQARQTEAFRATPDATFHYSLFIYLRLLGPLFLLHVSPYLRVSLFIPFSRSLPLFFSILLFSSPLSLLCSPAAVSPAGDNVSRSINANDDSSLSSFFNRKNKNLRKHGVDSRKPRGTGAARIPVQESRFGRAECKESFLKPDAPS